MATAQAWDDFKRLHERWRGVLSLVATLKNECDALESLQGEVIDDGPRLSAMTAIGNQYPGFNMNSIKADVERVIGLKAILTEHGF